MSINNDPKCPVCGTNMYPGHHCAGAAPLYAGWRPPSDAALVHIFRGIDPDAPNVAIDVKYHDAIAAARREALEEVRKAIKSTAENADAYEHGPDFYLGLASAEAEVRALLDQPAPAAPDYRALCERLVGALNYIQTYVVFAGHNREAVERDCAKINDALRAAEQTGVKPREEG